MFNFESLMTQKKTWSLLLAIVKLERADLATLVSYGIGIGLLSLATPVVVQSLVNSIAFGALLQPLFVLTIILLVLLACSNSLVGLQFYVVEMLQRRLFVRFFGETASRLNRSDYAVRDSEYLPELTNRFFDVITLQKTVASLLLETLGYVLQTLIGMILLAFYHPMLLAFDLFLVVALYIILFVLSRHGLDTAIEQSRAKYASIAWLENIAINGILGKSQTENAFVEQRTQTMAAHYLNACQQHFQVLWRQNIIALVVHTLANTLLLGMGGWMVIERQLSLGQLIAAELVVNAMVYGFTRIGKTLDNVYELMASLNKIEHLLDLPQEHTDGAKPPEGKSGYQVDVYSLSFSDSQSDSIDQLELHLRSGEKWVLTSGVERGSLLDLLYGLRSPLKGRICIDDQDLRDLNLGQLRNTICLIRHIELIEASIAENLQIGYAVTLQEMRNVLIQVGLFETLSTLPNGLNTPLKVHGTPLTEEQCLRLMLARAILRKPRLLLIDKTLDYLPERDLEKILTLLLDSQAWTLIVVSQHALVINAFDKKAHINQGRIVIEDRKHG